MKQSLTRKPVNQAAPPRACLATTERKFVRATTIGSSIGRGYMASHSPELSIGILAHNEERRIGQTLQTLFAQDVFEKYDAEVVIVANGCRDNTAAAARRLIHDHRAIWSDRGSARVAELTKAGKANAWNQFVHELSSPWASYLILMDADIELLHTNTLSSMINTLRNNPQAVVCVDRPVKDIALGRNLTLLQRLLLATTPKIDPNNVPLCGQLYCVRSQELRLIRLPIEITTEDGFLRGLLLTRGFTEPEDKNRIILDSTAAHKFISVATLRETFKHEVWIVSGSIVNMLLFRRFSREAKFGQSAMSLMLDWQTQNPDWLRQYIRGQSREHGWLLLPKHWWTRRWSRLGKLPLWRRLELIPIAAIAAAMDLLVFVVAIRDVRHGRAFGYWSRK
jgi:glycosyltransferase involved in cell wall biosynthesis